MVSNYCSGQCFLNPSTTTSPQDAVFRTDELDLKEMTISLLEYVSIIKSEYWSSYSHNLTLTAPNDGSCCLLGDGQSLQTFTRKDNWEIHLSSIPILTDVLRLADDKFYIPSQSRSVLLNLTQFQSLTEQLDILLSLDDHGPPQLTIYRDNHTNDDDNDYGGAVTCYNYHYDVIWVTGIGQ